MPPLRSIAAWPVYPLLFAVYPPLFVFAHNAGKLAPAELWPPIAVCLAGTVVVWAVLAALFRDAARSALLVAALQVLCFGHGPARAAVKRAILSAADVGDTAWLVGWCAVTALVLVGTGLWLRGRHRFARRLALPMNAVALVLIALNLGSLVPSSTAARDRETTATARSGAADGSFRPDIYYIVLDGYGAGGVMRGIYGFDNRPFLDHLESRGFFVARQSAANYARTVLSLASSLGHEYIERKPPLDPPQPEQEFALLAQQIRSNAVFETLRRHGYAIYSFETGYGATEMRNLDGYVEASAGLSELSTQLWALTPLAHLRSGTPELDPYEAHRRRILATFAGLRRIATRPGPKLVFAHVLAPHPPFVFDAQGGAAPNTGVFAYFDGNHLWRRMKPEEYRERYAAQARFVTSQARETIDAILDRSQEPPVIVLQGDHGPGSQFHNSSLEATNVQERMLILNAYHLPAGGASGPKPYPRISPVNTFRLILSRYLGETLPLLPDHSYYTTDRRYFDPIDVTQQVRARGDGRR